MPESKTFFSSVSFAHQWIPHDMHVPHCVWYIIVSSIEHPDIPSITINDHQHDNLNCELENLESDSVQVLLFLWKKSLIFPKMIVKIINGLLYDQETRIYKNLWKWFKLMYNLIVSFSFIHGRMFLLVKGPVSIRPGLDFLSSR